MSESPRTKVHRPGAGGQVRIILALLGASLMLVGISTVVTKRILESDQSLASDFGRILGGLFVGALTLVPFGLYLRRVKSGLMSVLTGLLMVGQTLGMYGLYFSEAVRGDGLATGSIIFGVAVLNFLIAGTGILIDHLHHRPASD